jgi:hypothetical protein
MKNRRWSPGVGFIKLYDRGEHAIWVRPLDDGVLLAQYLPGCDRAGVEHFEKWIIEIPRGGDFMWTVLDKPHRIGWLLNDEVAEPGSEMWNVKIHMYEWSGPSHKQYRRGLWQYLRYNPWKRGRNLRSVWRQAHPISGRHWATRYGNGQRHDRIPRKILAALKPGLKELRAQASYRRAFWEEWAELHDHED